jgi:transposase
LQGAHNGEPERQIRYPAQGRRAYLFAGSDAGARRLATAYTLVANCRVEGINTCEYLADVLEKLAANWPQSRLDELLPRAWKRARQVAVEAPS